MNRRGAAALVLLAMLLIALVGASKGPAQSDATQPDITLHVSPVQINEARDTDAAGPGWGPSQVILQVTGEPMKRAVAFANFRVEQALDDAGENLVDSEDWELRRNTNIYAAHPVRLPDGTPSIKVTGLIHTPSKRTTKLVRLKGQFQVMTLSDESRSLVVPKLSTYITSRPEIKELVRERLTVDVGIDEGDNGKNLYANFNGNPAIVRRVQIIDAGGQILKKGYLPDDYDSNNNKQCSFFKLPRIVDDRMSLKIEFAANQKIVTVDFDLKDVPLP